MLLRRANRIGQEVALDAATDPDRAAATEISVKVDGLPLALDQAGAYIEETVTPVAEYLDLYSKAPGALLDEYGNPGDRDHDSVRRTFSLAFDQAQKTDPAVGDLLKACAFLAPDAIPEIVFTEGASAFGGPLATALANPVAWKRTLQNALRHSLLTRDKDTGDLSIHRLVQTVIREGLSKGERASWAHTVVGAVNLVFPNEKFEVWSKCARLQPQALACYDLVTEYVIETVEASRLLQQAGCYLRVTAQFGDAERLLLSALRIRETISRRDDSDTNWPANALGLLYLDQGRLHDAEPLLLRVVANSERDLGAVHQVTAAYLNNVANLYVHQGLYEKARPLCERVLAIRERVLGEEHPNTARSLSGLG